MKDEKGKEIIATKLVLSRRPHCAKAPLSSLCRTKLKNPCSTIEGVCCPCSYFPYNPNNQTSKKHRPALLKFTKSHKPHRFLFASMKFLAMKSPKSHKNNGQQVIKSLHWKNTGAQSKFKTPVSVCFAFCKTLLIPSCPETQVAKDDLCVPSTWHYISSIGVPSVYYHLWLTLTF